MHEPYENRLQHKADFRVKYRFRSAEEGGRLTGPAFQGYRSDFSFVGVDGVFRIWPEFEDTEGHVILHNDRPVPVEGTARMWVIHPEMGSSFDDVIGLYHFDKPLRGIIAGYLGRLWQLNFVKIISKFTLERPCEGFLMW